jgi:hypothetical protein
MVYIYGVEARVLKLGESKTQRCKQAERPMICSRLGTQYRLVFVQSRRFLAEMKAKSAIDWWIDQQVVVYFSQIGPYQYCSTDEL